VSLNIGIVFLGIDDRDGGYGHNVFHLGIPEYNVHRTAHSHQDRNAASSSGVKPSQSGHCTKSSFATVAPWNDLDQFSA